MFRPKFSLRSYSCGTQVHHPWHGMTYHDTAITAILSQKFMLTRLLIAFEDLLASSIASQVVPPCSDVQGVPEKTHFQNATERPRDKNGRTDPRAHSKIPIIMTTEGF